MAISSQAPKGEGSETTGIPEYRAKAGPKRPAPNANWGEDIVRSSRKREAVLKTLVRHLRIRKNGCWEWLGATTVGYGSFRLADVVGGIKLLAHRASWVAFKGEEIKDGLFVCHHCDNPLCFNPDHLFLGSQQENMKDRDQKGRTLSGELVATAKYSKADISNVVEMLEKGCSGVEISHATGISRTHVSRIRNGYSRVSDTDRAGNWVHANRKYTDEQLLKVARLVATGELGNPKIAKLAGVKVSLVSDMRRGKAHKRFMERVAVSDRD